MNIIKFYFTFLSFNVLLLNPLFGMEKSEDYKQETKLNALVNGSEFLNDENPLPQEIFNVIFDDLSADDLKILQLTTKFLASTVQPYQYQIIDRLVNDLTQLPFTLSFKESLRDLSCTIDINPPLVSYLTSVFTKRMNENSFLLLPQKSPLAPYLYDHPQFVPLNSTRLMNYLDIVEELYHTVFDAHLLKNQEEKMIALDHLQASWPLHNVFFHKDKVYDGLPKFFKKHKNELIEQLTSLRNKKPHFSLINAQSTKVGLATVPHNIVITTKQLKHEGIRTYLNELFRNNSGHTLCLTIGESYLIFNKNLYPESPKNSFNLSSENLPSKIKYLRLLNPSGSIRSIEENLLAFHPSLESIEISGLYNLENIEIMFLASSKSLKSVDISGLSKLTTIKGMFLHDCTSLQSFDILGLNWKIKISDENFLENCPLDDVSKKQVEELLQRVRPKIDN